MRCPECGTEMRSELRDDGVELLKCPECGKEIKRVPSYREFGLKRPNFFEMTVPEWDEEVLGKEVVAVVKYRSPDGYRRRKIRGKAVRIDNRGNLVIRRDNGFEVSLYPQVVENIKVLE
ncbi:MULTISPECIES: zf-TFIIB domain-containing protein [unclassified Methanopyrus]|uniref:zf-TFIIB domain-containing protein n=1 Tax=unclassified Methanopyrus TaxID=2684913 RepID=UPI000B4AD080|nr:MULTISPECIES: zinc ribbon domain-containing protein [unclassified Methanopyrus]